MLTALVVLCPPLAVLLTASPTTAAKNFGLWMLGIVPGVLHARRVVEQYTVSRRYNALMQLLESKESASLPANTQAA